MGSGIINPLRVLEGRPKPLSEIAERLRPSLPVANDREAVAVLNGLCALISVAGRLEGDAPVPDRTLEHAVVSGNGLSSA